MSVGIVRNEGQWSDAILYGATCRDYVVRIYDDGFELARAAGVYGVAEAVRFRFESERVGAGPNGESPLKGRHHFFYGADPSGWRVDVPAFDQVRFAEVAPGIDVTLSIMNGRLHYDLHVTPAADLGRFGLRCDQVSAPEITTSGVVRWRTRTGWLEHSRPVAYERESDGSRREVQASFVLDAVGRIGLAMTSAPGSSDRVIDPGIEWSTFLGGVTPAPGSGLQTPWPNIPYGARNRHGGSVVIAGITGRIDFPVTGNAFDSTYSGGKEDGFISEVTEDGSNLVFSTYFGGATTETIQLLELAASGSIVISGTTNSVDFPVTPGGPQGVGPSGTGDMFFARMNRDGSSLEYSVVVPGKGTVLGGALTMDEGIVIAGTASAGFPTTPGAFDVTHGGKSDGFVTRLSPDASALVFSTYVGGLEDDALWDVASHPDGTISVAGYSSSPDYPTTPGAFQPIKHTGPRDGVVTRLSATGSSLVASTFVGGNFADTFYSIAIDRHDRVTVTGTSSSLNFPTTPGAFQNCCGGGPEAVVVRLAPDFSSLGFSTLFGGIGIDESRNCRLDAAGNVVFTGFTYSDYLMGFPTTKGAWKEQFFEEPSDGFVAYMTKDGSSLLYSTLIGGTDVDFSGVFNRIGLDLDGSNAATICGVVSSPDYPVTPGAFDTTWFPELGKAVVTRLDLLPKGVTKYGDSTPGCEGPLAIGVDSMPYLGNESFGIRCVGSRPNGPGWVLFAEKPLATPWASHGITFHVDPAGSAIFSVLADGDGETRIRHALPVDPGLLGYRAYVQFVFRDECGSFDLAASNALAIEIQTP